MLMKKTSIRSISVTINKWNEYNKSKKKSMSKFFLSTNFVDDDKILKLSTNQRLLYVWLLTMRSRQEDDKVTFIPRQADAFTSLGRQMENAILTLEENQLVTVVDIERPLLNELNSKEKNPKEIPAGSTTPPVQAELIPESPKKTSTQIWKAYEEAFVTRYKQKPDRNAKANAAAKKILDSIGEAEGIELVKFYLTHTDGLYLKSMHELSVCAMHIHALTIQRRKGIKFTSSDVRRFEKEAEHQAQLDRLGEMS